jgi:hypothetical protein
MILIADNLQITNPDIEKAVAGFHADPIQELVLACEKAADALISQKPFAWNGWGSVMNSDN